MLSFVTPARKNNFREKNDILNRFFLEWLYLLKQKSSDNKTLKKRKKEFIMKTIQEVKAQFKKEGLYFNNPQFELTPEVKEVLHWACEFYGYITVIENDVVYQISMSVDEPPFTRTYQGKEGFIDCLESWYYTIEGNYDDLAQEVEPDEETIASTNFYKKYMDIIHGFIETVK